MFGCWEGSGFRPRIKYGVTPCLARVRGMYFRMMLIISISDDDAGYDSQT